MKTAWQGDKVETDKPDDERKREEPTNEKNNHLQLQ